MSSRKRFADSTTRSLVRTLEQRRNHAEELAEMLHEEIDGAHETQDMSDLIDEDGGYAPEGEEMVAVAELLEHEISDIDEALDRAERGELGTCARCGARIPLQRLRAVPSTAWCVECSQMVHHFG